MLTLERSCKRVFTIFEVHSVPVHGVSKTERHAAKFAECSPVSVGGREGEAESGAGVEPHLLPKTTGNGGDHGDEESSLSLGGWWLFARKDEEGVAGFGMMGNGFLCHQPQQIHSVIASLSTTLSTITTSHDLKAIHHLFPYVCPLHSMACMCESHFG